MTKYLVMSYHVLDNPMGTVSIQEASSAREAAVLHVQYAEYDYLVYVRRHDNLDVVVGEGLVDLTDNGIGIASWAE